MHKIKELLKVVTTWFRDAMLYRETGDSDIERLMNSEQVEAMKNFSHNFPDADLYQSVLEVEKSLELIDRHVQVNLILIVLLNKLRSYIRK
ncbi:hypothetical protein GWO43_29705 [candidate division KSB1 bacterium]|nr:hypothetical protein [candidate division KSB1 bacterium]NIX74641.1 hypothetical protein [candidate division KSB1 bacterium]